MARLRVGDVFVPPAPYTAAQVSATGRAQFDQTASITIGVKNHAAGNAFRGGRVRDRCSFWGGEYLGA